LADKAPESDPPPVVPGYSFKAAKTEMTLSVRVFLGYTWYNLTRKGLEYPLNDVRRNKMGCEVSPPGSSDEMSGIDSKSPSIPFPHLGLDIGRWRPVLLTVPLEWPPALRVALTILQIQPHIPYFPLT